ncbi:MAG: UbiD family decarboxylase [Candidatus Latescibacterota bacterium]|nr:UbiD family decarboxylase [Candidatus Latescibacterota bacterium]
MADANPTYTALGPFLEALRREGELVEVDTPVSADLEIAEIHRRVIAAAGPALLFRNVEGTRFPCVTNLFGTSRRVDMAFGPRPERVIRELVEVAQDLPYLSPSKLWGHRGLAREGLRLGMKTVESGPVVDRIQDPPDLKSLPLLKTWPEDGGAFATLPLVYTEHPETGHHNLGMYRIQRYDGTHAGVHWQIQKGGGFHYHVAEQRDEALPLTVFVGGPPALILSAIGPLPENMPELILASLLQGEKLRRVRNPGSHPHALIAEAEFAIQGRVAPKERRPEGPFGDHYGYYSLQHDYPVLQVERVYHRRDAIWPATVVGKPPQEDLRLGNYIQDLMAPLSRLVMPAIRSIWSYGETGYHCLSSIVVEERYPREAMKFAFRILGEDGGQLALTKFLVVVDDPALDQRDFRQVLAYVLARCRFETDLFVLANLAMDTLDYSGPAINEGSKGILLGIGEARHSLPSEFRGALPAGARAAGTYCPGALVVESPTYADDPEYARTIATDPVVAEWRLIFLLDDLELLERNVSFLWAAFTRFEPAADIHAASSRLHRHHEMLTEPVVFDCRLKPGFPKELIADDDTVARVTRRWPEYFPDGNVEGEETPWATPSSIA